MNRGTSASVPAPSPSAQPADNRASAPYSRHHQAPSVTHLPVLLKQPIHIFGAAELNDALERLLKIHSLH